jgi:hypothetical protein
VSFCWVNDFLEAHPDLSPGSLPGPKRNGNELACAWRWRFVADLLGEIGEAVTLVDSDLMFWASPDVVFDEIGDAPLAVSPHGFAPAAEGLPGVTLESHGVYGAMNGGFSVWRDPHAARRMAELARGWSSIGFMLMSDGRRRVFGDQGWLETVAQEFGGHVIRHPGINVGPWNVHRFPLLNYRGDQRLIAYHYSSLRWNPDGSFRQFADPAYAVTAEQQRLIYDPYVAEVLRHV